MALSFALELLAGIERSLLEHNVSGIIVDIRILAGNEYVLFISLDNAYVDWFIWCKRDWERWAKQYVYKQGRRKNGKQRVPTISG